MAIRRAFGFFVLPFGIDGEPVGFGFWELSALSDKWLSVCEDFLATHGEVFDAFWEGAHIPYPH